MAGQDVVDAAIELHIQRHGVVPRTVRLPRRLAVELLGHAPGDCERVLGELGGDPAAAAAACEALAAALGRSVELGDADEVACE